MNIYTSHGCRLLECDLSAFRWVHATGGVLSHSRDVTASIAESRGVCNVSGNIRANTGLLLIINVKL